MFTHETRRGFLRDSLLVLAGGTGTAFRIRWIPCS